MQLGKSFQNVVTTLSWFVFNYKFVSDLVATTRGMARFLNSTEEVATSRSRHGPLRLTTAAQSDAADSRPGDPHPGRSPLLEIGELTSRRGQTVWLSGVSGLGKSTLFKALAECGRMQTARRDTATRASASAATGLPAARLCLPRSAIYPALPDALVAYRDRGAADARWASAIALGP